MEVTIAQFSKELNAERNKGIATRPVTLQIKKIWFDLIASGLKKTEVRASTIRNMNLLKNVMLSCDSGGTPTIRLLNGMRKDAPSLVIEVLSYRIDVVTEDMNVPPDFVGQTAILLQLGEKVIYD